MKIYVVSELDGPGYTIGLVAAYTSENEALAKSKHPAEDRMAHVRKCRPVGKPLPPLDYYMGAYPVDEVELEE